MPVHLSRPNEDPVLAFGQRRMPAPLPVAVHIQPGAARHIRVDRLTDGPWILILEQHILQEGADVLTGADNAAWMRLEGEGAHLDEDRWPVAEAGQEPTAPAI